MIFLVSALLALAAGPELCVEDNLSNVIVSMDYGSTFSIGYQEYSVMFPYPVGGLRAIARVATLKGLRVSMEHSVICTAT